MSKFAIATFCYGERYHNQVNRMISKIDECDFKPTVVVVTDNVDKILKKEFVKCFDISSFNPDYKNYSESYYSFDFSVKRYSLLAALNLGFTKIILSDADAVPNSSLFTEDNIMKGFVHNSIQGQVTYNFSDQIMTNSELGKRFLAYENHFGVLYDKNELNFMPEDCIQFLDIEISKFYNFLKVWNDCIKYKIHAKLSNTPAGNIDEMCFSALKCGISVGNNSEKVMNALTPIHDKWYDSPIVPIEEKSQKKKKIVSSVYHLEYIDERGSGTYKGFDLLTKTIRNIIFPEYEYVVYTNEESIQKFDLKNVFDYPNVTIKICELNSEYYINELNPVRMEKNSSGEIWDRIFCVNNYIEVIYNKLKFLIDESIDFDGDVVWVDAGLFGTSCSNGWRDYMNEICHSNLFLEKIFEKINEFDFISLLGKEILINYEFRDKIQSLFNTYPLIVPGCLFGGKSNKIIEYLSEYKSVISVFLKERNYPSEQEVLFLLLQNKKVRFFEFNDWDDLQKGILKIMDMYDEEKYNTNSCISSEDRVLIPQDLSTMSFTELADYCNIDKGSLHEGHLYTKTYEEYLTKYKLSEPVIVEIGINDSRFPGGCLKFWDLVFEKMEYYGFDITDCSNLIYNQEKIKTFQGDQNNVNDLKEFVYKFDLPNRIDFIIDDGSHISEHIITSFKTLFPYLKKGGIYFIEDLHAGWAEKDTTLSEINKIIFNNSYEVSEIKLVSNDKLLIIIK